jgi:mono/diheme cytochrome c family protein
VLPIHLEGESSADGTRCVGCHHAGGPGGAGAFADRTFLDARGDDLTTATVRAPRMLAGAAVLELLGEDHPERSPFGWSPGAARTLRAHVERGVRWHLAEEASALELDALVVAIAALPLPVEEFLERDSLRQRVPHGRELFATYGCASCHTPGLPLSRFQLRLSERRTLDLEKTVRAQLGTPSGPVMVPLFSDLLAHDLGTGGSFVTPPLWGLASRLTYLHDGRASTFEEAIRAHGGEAKAARDAWELDQIGRRDLTLFLLTLTRPTRLEGSP